MRVTELAEDLRDALNASDAGDWSDSSFVVGTGKIEAVCAFDPLQCFEELTTTSLFIIPDGFEALEGQNRQRITTMQTTKRLAIVLTHPFDGISTNIKDVTSWNETKQLLNLFEDIFNWVTTYDFPEKMISVETEQFFDDPLEKNTYMANIILSFEGLTCGFRGS